MSWQIYTQYDEDGLTTHSNAGLLRRARKALEDVTLISQETNQLLFKVEDCDVILPNEGITKANCTCPAQGCCKHILSSILWIQENTAILANANINSDAEDNNRTKKTKKSSKAKDNTDTENTLKTALDIVLNYDIVKIQKKAGKANVRLAYELVQNWQQQPENCNIDIQTEKISFQTNLSPNNVLLYPTTGLEGMLSEIADKQKLAGHLACIAYLFLKHAPDKWQWLEKTIQPEAISNNALSQDDIEFIQELIIICQNFIQHGLSHLAKEAVMALHIFNMQARAQNLPRLGSLLRSLHGSMSQFLAEDNVLVDEPTIFNQLAYLYAYLIALSGIQHLSPDIQADTLTKLRGTIRKDYQQETIDHLIPLGCEWWITDSGARGLTACFWDVTQSRLKEVTQARANYLDQTFDKYSAAYNGIWGSSLDFLLQHQLTLTHAKVNSETTLSASSDTRFVPKELFSNLNKRNLEEMNIGISDWHHLQEFIKPHSSLDTWQSRYILLRHKKIMKPDLNELEQCFECRIVDSNDVIMKLSLPVEPIYQQRIEHFSYLIQHENIIATLVRIDRAAQHIQFIPCSAILETKKGLQIFSLDYDRIGQKKKAFIALITGRIAKLLQQKKQWHKQQILSPLDRLTLETQTLLEFYANTGRAVLDHEDQAKITSLSTQFADLGLSFIAKTLNSKLPNEELANNLLKWRHVLLQLQYLNQKIVLEKDII